MTKSEERKLLMLLDPGTEVELKPSLFTKHDIVKRIIKVLPYGNHKKLFCRKIHDDDKGMMVGFLTNQNVLIPYEYITHDVVKVTEKLIGDTITVTANHPTLGEMRLAAKPFDVIGDLDQYQAT